MRRADQAARPEQHIVLRRLLLEHVERRAGDMAAVERVLERRFVDQPAARAIDDPHAGLGPGQRLAREDAARLIGQRRVEGDEIGAGEQFVELGLLDPELDRPLGREERVVGDDLHLQAVGAVGDDRADIAAADQAQCLAGQLDPHEAVLLPLARLGRLVGLRDLAGEREQHRDRVLGGGDRIAERRVHDHDPAGRGGGHVDRIDADAGAADHLEAGQSGIHHRGIDLGRAAHGEPVVIADDRRQLLRGQAGPLVDRDPALAEDRRGAGIHLVGDEDAYLPGHFTCSHAQSSHGPSASMSALSTVAPHQMRRPGGASR